MSEKFRLKNETLFVVAEAVGGFYNADQLRAVAEISENESALLKLTEEQSIGFMLREEKLPEIETQLRKAGLILQHYRSHQIPFARSCLGELCPHFEQDALGDSIEIGNILSNAFPEGAPYLKIGINGCARNCLASGTDDIHIVGEQTGYKIQIGGKSAELPQIGQFLAENVSGKELGNYLIHIINKFTSELQDGEGFYDVVDRVGVSTFELIPDAGSEHSEEYSKTEDTGLTDVSDQADQSDLEADDLSIEDSGLTFSDYAEEGEAMDQSRDPNQSEDLDQSIVLEHEEDFINNLDSVLDGSSDALDEEVLENSNSDADFSMEEADALLSDEQHEEVAQVSLEDNLDAEFEHDLNPQEDPHDEELDVDVTAGEEDASDTTHLTSEIAAEELSFDPGYTDSPETLELSHSEFDETQSETLLESDETHSDEADLDMLEEEDEADETDGSDQATEDSASLGLQLIEEDAGFETEDATEDDVTRVTQAMRSEAAFDQGGQDLSSTLSTSSSGMLSDSLSQQNNETLDETQTQPEEEMGTETADSEVSARDYSPQNEQDEASDGEADIPSSFLKLQDQASNSGALQVRLVEDILSIVTPENSRINLPFRNLQSGMKVIMTIGKFNFETQVESDTIFIKFDQTTLSIPLATVTHSVKKAA